MIEREILEIVTDAKDRGERLNEIVDQFRRGRDVNQLIVLLDSGNSELVSIGAWILGELHFEFYNSDSFVFRLRELLDHKDPAVRFHALGAVFPALTWQEVATQALLRKLRSDPNEGVRKSAEAAVARLSLT
jgi:HEAT repeat protein